jgi:hypothetical protein
MQRCVDYLREEGALLPDVRDGSPAGAAPERDLSAVRGQAQAKRALEVAAAGGHNVLITGPPTAGNLVLVSTTPPRVGEMSMGPRKAGLAWRRSDDRHSRPAGFQCGFAGCVHRRQAGIPPTWIALSNSPEPRHSVDCSMRPTRLDLRTRRRLAQAAEPGRMRQP